MPNLIIQDTIWDGDHDPDRPGEFRALTGPENRRVLPVGGLLDATALLLDMLRWSHGTAVAEQVIKKWNLGVNEKGGTVHHIVGGSPNSHVELGVRCTYQPN